MSETADDFFRRDAERLGYLGPEGPGLAQYYRDYGMTIPERKFHDPEIAMDPDVVVSILDHRADRRHTNGRYSGTGHLAVSDDG